MSIASNTGPLIALDSERIRADLEGKTVRKVIVVKGKLVNIVVG